MAVTVNPVFGSFNYAANNCELIEWNDDYQVRQAVASIPRSHRARNRAGFSAPRAIRATGRIGLNTWQTRDDLRAAEDAFQSAHLPLGLAVSYQKLYRDTDRYIQAETARLTWGDTGLLWKDFTVEWVCPDPFWYATAAEATDTWAAPATGGTRTITNGGSVFTHPIFTITMNSGGTLALSLTNTSIADHRSFSLNGTVGGGDVIGVDCDAQTVTLNGSNKMSFLSGSFFRLAPGANVLTLSLSGPTLTSILTNFTKRWI